jgi:hypothetical protein
MEVSDVVLKGNHAVGWELARQYLKAIHSTGNGNDLVAPERKDAHDLCPNPA